MEEIVLKKFLIKRCCRIVSGIKDGLSKMPWQLSASILGVISIFSCTQDQVLPREKCEDKVTYDEIKFLLNRKCGSSGCHDGTSGYGDFRSYNGLKTDISNGNIEAEVIQKGTMPQEDTLSAMEFHLIQCWIDNGYLQE